MINWIRNKCIISETHCTYYDFSRWRRPCVKLLTILGNNVTIVTRGEAEAGHES